MRGKRIFKTDMNNNNKDKYRSIGTRLSIDVSLKESSVTAIQLLSIEISVILCAQIVDRPGLLFLFSLRRYINTVRTFNCQRIINSKILT